MAAEAVDLRRGFDGLAATTRSVIRQDPLNGHLFVFLNRRKNRVKASWSGTARGIMLVYKRLDQGRRSRCPLAPARRAAAYRGGCGRAGATSTRGMWICAGRAAGTRWYRLPHQRVARAGVDHAAIRDSSSSEEGEGAVTKPPPAAVIGIGGDMLGEHLDGDGAVEGGLTGFVRFAHSAGADLGGDPIRSEGGAGLQRHSVGWDEALELIEPVLDENDLTLACGWIRRVDFLDHQEPLAVGATS